MASSYKKTIVLGLDYSEFEGGLKECNTQMKNLDAEFAHSKSQMGDVAKQSEKLQLQSDYLSQKMILQRQKVEELSKKYDTYMTSLGETASKTEKANQALLKARTELNNLENEYDALILKQSGLKESATMLVGVLGTISAGILSSAKAAAEYADEMITLSDKTGVAVETLEKWEYASEFVDVSLETMTGSFKKLESSMESASSGSGSAAEAFSKLGLKSTDASGKMKSAEQMFYEVIDALGKVENATEQDQLAMAIFGKSASELTGVINAGSEGLKAYGEEAEKLGRIMSSDDLEKASELKDAMDSLDAAFESLKLNLGTEFIPIITDLISAIASIPTPVLKMIVVIGSVIATIVTLSATINSVVKAGSSIKAVFDIVSVGFDSTYVKIMAAVVALTALAVAIAVIIGKGDQLGNVLGSIGGMASSTNGNNNNRQQRRYNASGTQNWRGGETWVGENGPEIVSLPKGSKIYSNEDSKKIAGNTTYNINMNCDLSKMQSVSDVVKAVKGISQSAGCGVR